ncbi:MAG TPA: glycosyltransferase family 2 protein [Agriterribacter sp.]|nr:glycosyltransferase family 2 protein [Agriterribacter sp.]HRQ49603.1 glycosyltransferase family 2 protein [Agriterribacter sp.]
MQEKKYILVKAKPLISIITLNWNQTEITCQFLESARKLAYPHYEVLVCDMGSAADPTLRIIKGNYPNTRIIKTDTGNDNGVNWAVKQAKGDFILLVNNHTVLTENTLDDLIAPFLTDSLLGVACPKICSFHKKNEIQYAGYNALNRLTGRKTIIGHKKEDRGQYDTPVYTHGAYSGAMLIRKNVIEQPGMLPRNFFIYFDDYDISARILKKGYRILYQPKALVYNKAPLRPSEKSAINVYYNTRNRIQFMRRNSNLLQFAVFIFFFLLLTVPAATIRFLFKRQFTHLQSFFKGIWWNVKMRTAT